jgi:hypothetical protein
MLYVTQHATLASQAQKPYLCMPTATCRPTKCLFQLHLYGLVMPAEVQPDLQGDAEPVNAQPEAPEGADAINTESASESSSSSASSSSASSSSEDESATTSSDDDTPTPPPGEQHHTHTTRLQACAGGSFHTPHMPSAACTTHPCKTSGFHT